MSRLKRMLAVVLSGLALVTGIVFTAPAANAAGTTCRTLEVNQGFSLGFAIQPHMSVPVCYNGSQIWPNGGITPGVTTYGYSAGRTSFLMLLFFCRVSAFAYRFDNIHSYQDNHDNRNQNGHFRTTKT